MLTLKETVTSSKTAVLFFTNKRVRVDAKSACTLRHSRLSAYISAIPTGRIDLKFDIWCFYKNLPRNSIFYTNIHVGFNVIDRMGVDKFKPDQEGNKLQRQKILSFIYPIYGVPWRY